MTAVRDGRETGLAGTDLMAMGVGVLAVSTSGPLIAATAVPALAIAFWRNALAAGVLVPVVLLRRREELRGLTRREWRLAAVAGLMLALHFAVWIPSVTLTSVATATALVATQPVWTALIAAARGAPVPPAVLVGIAVALTGALLLTGVDLRGDRDVIVGDVLALAGAVFAAAYVVAGAEVRRSVSTTTYTAICYAWTALLLLGVCLVGRQSLGGYEADDWLKLVGLTVGAQLLGHSMFSHVLRRASPTAVSLLILLEIPGAALIAWLVLDQRIPVLAVPAALLLVAGLAIVIRAGGRTAVPAIPVE